MEYRKLIPLILFFVSVFLVIDNYLRSGTLFQLSDILHHETLIVVFVLSSFFSYFKLKNRHIKEKHKVLKWINQRH